MTFKDAVWSWRCRVLGTKDEKSLSDYSSSGQSEAKPADSQPAKEPLGGALIVKTMYGLQLVGDNVYNWTDQPPRPRSKKEVKEAKASSRVAITIYKVPDDDKMVVKGLQPMKHHRIVIRNLRLVAALEPLLRAQDIHLDPEEPAEFDAPFQPLFFGYDAIVSMLRGTADADSFKPFLQLLVCVLDELFAATWAKRRQLAARGLINFEYAWTYFPRGTVVRSRGANCDLLSRVVRTKYRHTQAGQALVVTTEVLRFNGEAFEWTEQPLSIGEFAGNRPLAEFDHCPLTHVADAAELQTRLAARGRLVLDFQGLSYCHYDGVGIQALEQGRTAKHNVDSRILVDVAGYRKHQMAQGAREGKDNTVVDGTGRQRLRRRRGQVDEAEDEHRSQVATTVTTVTADPSEKLPKTRRLSAEEQAANKAAMLARPDDLQFVSPLIEAYSLKNKLWLIVYIEDIRPVQWNDQAYEHLVYDEQQKDMVLSFVESHGRTRVQVDDVILGKGSGLVVLLSGPPGTGKTLLAEAVADRTKRPLFYLQAEDLGINAAALGANVKKLFQMATEWDAIILLDEADVFMAERHPQDIARNELVSIFLRELEYFGGIIFLTTNLFGSIDKAFRSRVSLHLLFQPLLPAARQQIWRKFLTRAVGSEATQKTKSKGKELARIVEVDGKCEGEDDDDDSEDSDSNSDSGGIPGSMLSGADLQELSAWNLNGREIKTAVAMVAAWCEHKGHALTLERLEHGIQATSPQASKTALAENDDLYD